MRNYVIHSKEYTIERNRYHELKSFCRQYRLWKVEAGNCYGLSGVRYNGVPSKGVSDPTARAAERAMSLQSKIDMVEKCAMNADPVNWQHILWNVTEGLSYDILCRQGRAPLCGINQFYEARRKFFWLLDKEKD